MKFRKALSLLALAAAAMSATSCTARYQDMLRDRDDRIRALTGRLSQLENENDELQRQLTDTPVTTPVNAQMPRNDPGSLLDELKDDLGSEATVSYRNGRYSIEVKNEVTFDSGSTALKSSAHNVLRKVASALRAKFSGHRLFVEGHTDTDPIRRTKGKFRSNRHLSMERADKVAEFLVKQGVPESSIVTVGYGQYDPVNPGNKASNRRVVVKVGDRM